MDGESVLICTYSAGTGHHKVSEAVKEAITAVNPETKVYIIDPLEFCLPVSSALLTNFYLKIIKRAPVIYRYIYEKAELHTGNRFNLFWRIICLKAFPKLDSFIGSIQPKVIICTHPFAAVLMDRWRVQGRRNAPTVTGVITDYTIHPFWAGTDLDGYFLAAPELLKEAVQKGLPRERLWAEGIPLRKGFDSKKNRKQIMKDLGLRHDMKTILVMGGGLGLGDIENVVSYIGTSGVAVQVVVVSGNNQQLQCRLADIVKDMDIPVKVYGFVENIPDIMSSADLIITKPGGVTVSESLACGLPILLWKPIPGQEEKNAAFLTGKGLAFQAGNKAELVSYIRRIPDTASLKGVRHNGLYKMASLNIARVITRVYLG